MVIAVLLLQRTVMLLVNIEQNLAINIHFIFRQSWTHALVLIYARKDVQCPMAIRLKVADGSFLVICSHQQGQKKKKCFPLFHSSHIIVLSGVDNIKSLTIQKKKKPTVENKIILFFIKVQKVNISESMLSIEEKSA